MTIRYKNHIFFIIILFLFSFSLTAKAQAEEQPTPNVEEPTCQSRCQAIKKTCLEQVVMLQNKDEANKLKKACRDAYDKDKFCEQTCTQNQGDAYLIPCAKDSEPDVEDCEDGCESQHVLWTLACYNSTKEDSKERKDCYETAATILNLFCLPQCQMEPNSTPICSY